MFLQILSSVVFLLSILKTPDYINTMKWLMSILSFFICIQLFACNNKSNGMTSTPNHVLNTDRMKFKIAIGEHTFTATLYNYSTVTALKRRLPVTISMKELNGNE